MITPATSGPLTTTEKFQFADDEEQFGERVAAWFLSESRGWSALYDHLYWAEVRQHATSFKEPQHWSAA